MRAYDLVVLGAGTGGIIAAKTAARLGARVVLVERARPGGDCLWTGCVPSKSLLAAAGAAQRARTSGRFGVDVGEPRVDFAAVMAYVRRTIGRLEPADSPETLAAAGVEVLAGDAVFTGPGHVRVDSRVLPFRRAVVATGSSPAVPPIPGLADAAPLTSDTVWDLEELPARLAVLGGGPIGCELGQAFARLGSEVTVIEAADGLLPTEEPRASDTLSSALSAEGMRLLTSTTVDNVRTHRGELELVCTGTQGSGTIALDRILVAAGRDPGTAGLGLAAAGVDVDVRGNVVVDSKLRTSNRRVFAAGDVTGVMPFTHVAGMHGSIAATNALLAPTRTIDHDTMPWVTFTDPEVAQVGLTEERARQRHGDGIRVRVLQHEEVDRAVTEDAAGGFTHVVLDARGRVVGASIVAPHAGEMIAELSVLVARGGKLRDLAGVVHPYPTWADGVWNAAVAESDAALDRPLVRRAIHALLRLRRLR